MYRINALVMKKVLLLLLLYISDGFAQSSKYYSKTAQIAFDAEGKLDDVEEIKASSNSAICVYDAHTGNFQWSIAVKSFQFANSLMKKHFDENYLEVEQYPKATFIGKVDDPTNIQLNQDGTYSTKVSGKLSIHGVSKDISITGTFIVKNGNITASCNFDVALKDYKIEVPTLVFMKVAENVKINVYTSLQALKQ